jgi:hypothetical protein
VLLAPSSSSSSLLMDMGAGDANTGFHDGFS